MTTTGPPEEIRVSKPAPATREKELSEKVVEAKVKLIIKTVLERCEKEKAQNALAVPLEACEQRASYYTAFPSYCILEIRDEGKYSVITNHNIREKLLVLNAFKELYGHKQPHTYKQVLEIFAKHNIFKDDPAKFMKGEWLSLGYEYRLTQYGPILVENSEIRYQRFNYLNKIIKFRNKNRQICYVEVRIIDKSAQFQKFRLSLDDDSDNNKYYFLHAISRNGYINGIFCNIMDRDILTRWITDVLVTMLAPESVIVLNSGELFNEKINSITKYSSRQDMLQWLYANNIPCTSGMYKPELYELIKRSGIKDCEYKIDNILKAHGHNVLRLPQKFEDLTPTELLWKHMRTEEYSESLLLVGLKSAIEKFISNIDKLKWELFSDAVSNWEKEIFEADATIEQLLDMYKFDTELIYEHTKIPEYFFTS